MLEELVIGEEFGFCNSTNRRDWVINQIDQWLLTAFLKGDLQVHFCYNFPPNLTLAHRERVTFSLSYPPPERQCLTLVFSFR